MSCFNVFETLSSGCPVLAYLLRCWWAENSFTGISAQARQLWKHKKPQAKEDVPGDITHGSSGSDRDTKHLLTRWVLRIPRGMQCSSWVLISKWTLGALWRRYPWLSWDASNIMARGWICGTYKCLKTLVRPMSESKYSDPPSSSGFPRLYITSRRQYWCQRFVDSRCKPWCPKASSVGI